MAERQPLLTLQAGEGGALGIAQNPHHWYRGPPGPGEVTYPLPPHAKACTCSGPLQSPFLQGCTQKWLVRGKEAKVCGTLSR